MKKKSLVRKLYISVVFVQNCTNNRDNVAQLPEQTKK